MLFGLRSRYRNWAWMFTAVVVATVLVGGMGCGSVPTGDEPDGLAKSTFDTMAKNPHGGPPGGGNGGGGGGGGGGSGDPGAPVADAGADQQVDIGQLVVLDGSGSIDPDGDALTYAWTGKGKAKQIQLQNADTATASFYAPQVGAASDYRFTVTVSDGTSSSNDSANVRVTPGGGSGPEPALVIAATPTAGGTPLQVEFSASLTEGDPPSGTVYDWDFGDASSDQGSQVSHLYSQTGDFLATVCLVNQDGTATDFACATASITAHEMRTADMPDSWLVLYNLNSADSVQWKDWYLQQWGIPLENALGLDADPVLERIHKSDFQTDIFYPVSDHLTNNPALAAKIMGILVGYRVPGSFYEDASTPVLQGGGGWSVANKLQHLEPATVDATLSPQNPHSFAAYYPELTKPERLVKGTLAPYTYITARIDAPTLLEAQELTLRARTITTATAPLPVSDWLYHDYVDVGAPAGDEWGALRQSVTDLLPPDPSQLLPWQSFQSDGAGSETTPGAALRFSYYRVNNWHLAEWGGTPAGTRILAFAMNSWGATTLRSIDGHGGRYVPNALFTGGFAGAIGATAEPYASTVPNPSTVVWCLADGRTMGEAAFHANRFASWMWELVGDPLLTVPHWFDQ